MFTQPNQGANPALDSDADLCRADAGLYPRRQPDLTWGAGLHLTASLGDRVWYDRNHNGVQDGGEPGTPDVGVFLYDAVAVAGGYAIDRRKWLLRLRRATGWRLHHSVRVAGWLWLYTPCMGGNADLDSDADPDTGGPRSSRWRPAAPIPAGMPGWWLGRPGRPGLVRCQSKRHSKHRRARPAQCAR
ncbi:MAG: hypothetical protein IPF85_06290 [Anaerolineae bacterium]|nr:hypothetical protein [Anaerolineae bacterium]